jgi:lipoprotein-releasing system permease protein
MYKLLLVLRYLRRRRLTYFAAAGEALCVFMMLVAITVMNGFLGKAEKAAKGLHGDIVIQPAGLMGVALHDELSQRVLAEVPEVDAMSPMIVSYGILRVPGAVGYRQAVQIVGVRLPERATVCDFAKGLFVQKDAPEPTFDPPRDLLIKSVTAHGETIRKILDRAKKADRAEFGDVRFEELPADRQRARLNLRSALSYIDISLDSLHNNERIHEHLERLHEELIAVDDAGGDTSWIERQIDQEEARTIEPMPNRIILGLGLEGAFFRTDQGDTIRILSPGSKVTLYIFPLGQQSMTDVTPNIQRFTVVDDCTTDVYPFDSETVYVPFTALQRLNNMGPVERADGTTEPGRCSMIQVKINETFSTREDLPRIARDIRRVVTEFYGVNTAVDVQTWRQKQHKVVDQLESQRTLILVMFGILSLVSVVLVFVIFYMLVVQKTRDIGVLKAVGASSHGVAWIFLVLGNGVGLVGACIGAIGGCVFVHYINGIHDFIGRNFGFQVWSQESFWFDKIPNQIDPMVIVGVVIGAVLAGILGAFVPALRAARMQPVEALRYE